MRYLLFVLALLASISAVAVPTVTYAGPNGTDGHGESDPDCRHLHGGC